MSYDLNQLHEKEHGYVQKLGWMRYIQYVAALAFMTGKDRLFSLSPSAISVSKRGF